MWRVVMPTPLPSPVAIAHEGTSEADLDNGAEAAGDVGDLVVVGDIASLDVGQVHVGTEGIGAPVPRGDRQVDAPLAGDHERPDGVEVRLLGEVDLRRGDDDHGRRTAEGDQGLTGRVVTVEQVAA